MYLPLVNLQRQSQKIYAEVSKVFRESVGRGDFILGRAVEEFEKEFARYIGMPYGIGVANGTDALHLSLRVLDVGSTDEVILPANTFIATAFAVSQCGAKPVLVDCREADGMIDVAQIERAITRKTKAVIPVHLFGQSADMDSILRIAKHHRILVVEDAAQAHGARYKDRNCGAMGKLSAFSFYPAKNLGAYGDGGMILAREAKLAERLRRLRNLSSLKKYYHDEIGFNTRLDTLQAAILCVKLKKLDAWNQRRNYLASLYKKHLSGLLEAGKIRLLNVSAHTTYHVYHLFVIRLIKASQAKVLQALQKHGIGAGVHYPVPIHLQKAYRDLGYKKGSFPNAELLASTMISLPLCPDLKESELNYIVKVLEDVL